MLLIVIASALGSFVVAGLAKAQSRNPIHWYVISFLLTPPIAFIVLCCLNPGKIPCPNCDAGIQPGDLKCRECGMSFVGPDGRKQQSLMTASELTDEHFEDQSAEWKDMRDYHDRQRRGENRIPPD